MRTMPYRDALTSGAPRNLGTLAETAARRGWGVSVERDAEGDVWTLHVSAAGDSRTGRYTWRAGKWAATNGRGYRDTVTWYRSASDGAPGSGTPVDPGYSLDVPAGERVWSRAGWDGSYEGRAAVLRGHVTEADARAAVERFPECLRMVGGPLVGCVSVAGVRVDLIETGESAYGWGGDSGAEMIRTGDPYAVTLPDGVRASGTWGEIAAALSEWVIVNRPEAVCTHAEAHADGHATMAQIKADMAAEREARSAEAEAAHARAGTAGRRLAALWSLWSRFVDSLSDSDADRVYDVYEEGSAAVAAAERAYAEVDVWGARDAAERAERAAEWLCESARRVGLGRAPGGHGGADGPRGGRRWARGGHPGGHGAAGYGEPSRAADGGESDGGSGELPPPANGAHPYGYAPEVPPVDRPPLARGRCLAPSLGRYLDYAAAGRLWLDVNAVVWVLGTETDAPGWRPLVGQADADRVAYLRESGDLVTVPMRGGAMLRPGDPETEAPERPAGELCPRCERRTLSGIECEDCGHVIITAIGVDPRPCPAAEAAPEDACPQCFTGGRTLYRTGAGDMCGECARSLLGRRVEDLEPVADDDQDAVQPTTSSPAAPMAPAPKGHKAARGELRAAVAAVLANDPTKEFSPYQVAKHLGRSAGAVGNALETLVKRGEARKTQSKPRRYSAAADSDVRPSDGPHNGPTGAPEAAPEADSAPATPAAVEAVVITSGPGGTVPGGYARGSLPKYADHPHVRAALAVLTAGPAPFPLALLHRDDEENCPDATGVMVTPRNDGRVALHWLDHGQVTRPAGRAVQKELEAILRQFDEAGWPTFRWAKSSTVVFAWPPTAGGPDTADNGPHNASDARSAPTSAPEPQTGTETAAQGPQTAEERPPGLSPAARRAAYRMLVNDADTRPEVTPEERERRRAAAEAHPCATAAEVEVTRYPLTGAAVHLICAGCKSSHWAKSIDGQHPTAADVPSETVARLIAREGYELAGNWRDHPLKGEWASTATARRAPVRRRPEQRPGTQPALTPAPTNGHPADPAAGHGKAPELSPADRATVAEAAQMGQDAGAVGIHAHGAARAFVNRQLATGILGRDGLTVALPGLMTGVVAKTVKDKRAQGWSDEEIRALFERKRQEAAEAGDLGRVTAAETMLAVHAGMMADTAAARRPHTAAPETAPAVPRPRREQLPPAAPGPAAPEAGDGETLRPMGPAVWEVTTREGHVYEIEYAAKLRRKRYRAVRPDADRALVKAADGPEEALAAVRKHSTRRGPAAAEPAREAPAAPAGAGGGAPAPGSLEGAFTPAPGAERWDIRLARRVLTAAGFRDVDQDPNARDGFSVIVDGWNVGIMRVQAGDMMNPPRRGTAARQTWDAALDGMKEALLAAGWRIVRVNRVWVVGAAPVPDVPQTTARIRKGKLGKFSDRVTFDGWEGIGGTVTLHSTYAGANLYVEDHTGARIGDNMPDHKTAYEYLAHHYGLPMPIQIVRD